MPKRVIISLSNDVITDQRVLKIAEVISESGSQITILGRKLPESLPVSLLPYRVRRFRMLFRRGYLFYMFLNIRIFLYLLFHKADILVANDLDTVLPNYLISRLRAKPMVFDSHEYFTGVPELISRPQVRAVWKRIERFTIPGINFIMTVNNSIAGLLKDEYNVDPLVVRNLSKRYNAVAVDREKIGFRNEELLLILQGRGINTGRGAEELLQAVLELDGVQLMIVGGGDVLNNLKELYAEGGSPDKIKFFPVMTWEEMMNYSCSADIGISLDKGDCINSKFSLPNKIFDYLNSGLAVIASDLPEIRIIVEKFNCGLLINRVNKDSVIKEICLLRDNRVLLKNLKERARLASGELIWDNEKAKVRDFYTRAGLIFD